MKNPTWGHRMKFVPNIITLTGFLLGLMSICILGKSLLLFIVFALTSLICDILDGWTARNIFGTSDLGARLDWQVDCALAVATLSTLPMQIWIPTTVLCVAIQTVTSKYSGRSAIVILSIIFHTIKLYGGAE